MLDLRLPDTSGLELMHEMQRHPKMRDVPIVVYTGKELSPADETELRKIAKSIVLKDVRSPERLLDETALFLHRVVEQPSRRTSSRCSNVCTRPTKR